MEKDWVKLHSSASPEEMTMMKNMLEQHGIPAIVINQRDSAYLSFGEATLYVKNTDFIKAQDLVDRRDS
jgi:hypothetical protein